MDRTKFKKLLFEVACCAVACDHDIDEREIHELKHIGESTAYFKDIDLTKQLERFLDNFNGNEAETIDLLIQNIHESSMSPVEEFLIIEVVLRLIYADTKIDEREVNYLEAIRSALSISDELIVERFGEIPLHIKKQEILKPKSEIELRPSIDSAELINLDNIYSQDYEKE